MHLRRARLPRQGDELARRVAAAHDEVRAAARRVGDQPLELVQGRGPVQEDRSRLHRRDAQARQFELRHLSSAQQPTNSSTNLDNKLGLPRKVR